MGRTPRRIVSALLMSVVLTVPVLGAVCGTFCESGTEMRAHRSHAVDLHQAAAGSRTSGHHHASSVDSTAADHRHASSSATVSDAPQASAAWSGRCCDQPTLALSAIPVVRHDLQIDPATVDAVSLVASGNDVRQAAVRRDTSRAPSPPRQSNPILRI